MSLLDTEGWPSHIKLNLTIPRQKFLTIRLLLLAIVFLFVYIVIIWDYFTID